MQSEYKTPFSVNGALFPTVFLIFAVKILSYFVENIKNIRKNAIF